MLYKARASCQAGDSGYMIMRAIRCKKEIFSGPIAIIMPLQKLDCCFESYLSCMTLLIILSYFPAQCSFIQWSLCVPN